VARSSYYRWLREESWARGAPAGPVRPVQAFEALAEEKAAVRKYALQHPEVRHRELSWRMIDNGVVCLSASTVYRILREEKLIASWGRRKKRYREERERASRPAEIWGTDLMYLKVNGQQYFFVAFIDEYSRYIVHHELLTGMDGVTVSLAAERALETLPRTAAGTLAVKPEIRSDNGSGYISKEFHGLLEYHGLTHYKIEPNRSLPASEWQRVATSRPLRKHVSVVRRLADRRKRIPKVDRPRAFHVAALRTSKCSRLPGKNHDFDAANWSV
jgi:transposase InsO family protein